MNSPTEMPLVVGLKQTIKAIRNDKADKVYVARDAETRLIEPVIRLCIEKGVEVIFVDSMALLGKAVGIRRSASTATILR